MNISVFGLGYVGVVNIACFAKLGHTVYCCDVKPQKVQLLRNGNSTILEPQVDDMLEIALRQGLLFATTDAMECVRNTSLALICVGTPSDANGRVNLDYIFNTTAELANCIKSLEKKYTLVFRSTIPPNTIDTIILPEIERILGREHQIEVLFMPEFLREGSAVNDFFKGARIVIGSDNENKASQVVNELYSVENKTPVFYTDFVTSEFVKYVDNAFHATKVAFANEVYSIGAAYGVNVKRANDIFLSDEILNISTRYLKPGAPFGGSCLPKDTRAIVKLASDKNVAAPFFTGILESNKKHQERFYEKVVAQGVKRILIFGLTFKEHTDDVRESPYLALARELIKNNFEVQIFDNDLNLINLRVDFADISRFVITDLVEALGWAELLVCNKTDLSIVKNYKGITLSYEPQDSSDFSKSNFISTY